MRAGAVTLFLCGDVMLGRGIDQILPFPGDPALREPYVRDARDYVRMAEAANGPISRPADFGLPWGDALLVLKETAPDARLLNLETGITLSDDFDPAKSIHYRMNPANLPCLTAAGPDVCSLANNHVLDFGRRGLEETLRSLAEAGLRWAGAGRNVDEARRPATVPVEGGARVLVFSFGMISSGVSPDWAATRQRSGIDLVPRPSGAAGERVGERIRRAKRAGDVVVASIHWGSNWGYEVSEEQIDFAHGLVDAGTDIVYGHSSHHPRPIEVYRGRPILYGCGDLINDYEGIGGNEAYRDDLRPLYFVSVRPGSAEPAELWIVLMRAIRMRLRRAAPGDVAWLREILAHAGRDLGFGTEISLGTEGVLTARSG